ncbi:MAG: hypothetical protein AAF657_30370, partial [Acidobacteriota bacterium]
GPVACPFNPNVILVDFNEDDNGNEIPDALEDYIEDCNDPETCDDDGSGNNDGTGNNGEATDDTTDAG